MNIKQSIVNIFKLISTIVDKITSFLGNIVANFYLFFAKRLAISFHLELSALVNYILSFFVVFYLLQFCLLKMVGFEKWQTMLFVLVIYLINKIFK